MYCDDVTDTTELDVVLLLQACTALGVEFMVCEMGLRALDLEVPALRDDLPIRAGGLATLLGLGGQIVVL